MSTPLHVHNDNEERAGDAPLIFPQMVNPPSARMYAPPWARDAATDAADAAIGASEKLRSALPPAPLLQEPERRRRGAAAFEGDVAMRELRTRPSLDPSGVPEPPVVGSRSASYSLLGRLVGAGALAALAALFMFGGAPGSLRGAPSAADDAGPFWSRLFGASAVREALTPPKAVERRAEPAGDRPVPMMERFAAASPVAEPPVIAAQQPQAQVQTQVQPQVQPQPQVQAVEPPAPAPPPAFSPPVRSLDREEIAALYKRGEQLIQQGDIAAARLMFLRAAEVGDARSALALGASYDPDVLRKLGVLGVAADAAMAREWYSKASSYGSREAAQRINLLALGR
ncbi:MAG: hypothetical protein V7608_159, partial [Hyphomicrobiales bacterium]|jgi:hypothetical protein